MRQKTTGGPISPLPAPREAAIVERMTLQSASEAFRTRGPEDGRGDAPAPPANAPDELPPPQGQGAGCAVQGDLGTSVGVNIAPGSDDDGWIVPQPVRLADGTRLQLYKDGEALHAAYEAIKAARKRVCLEAYIFANDDTGNAFGELLAEKARHGVRVFVIYDAFGS